MADHPMKQFQSGGSLISSEVNTLFSLLRTRKTKVFFYGFVSAFVAGTVFLAFNPSGTSLASSQPWFNNISSAASHIFPDSRPRPSQEPIFPPGPATHLDSAPDNRTVEVGSGPSKAVNASSESKGPAFTKDETAEAVDSKTHLGSKADNRTVSKNPAVLVVKEESKPNVTEKASLSDNRTAEVGSGSSKAVNASSESKGAAFTKNETAEVVESKTHLGSKADNQTVSKNPALLVVKEESKPNVTEKASLSGVKNGGLGVPAAGNSVSNVTNSSGITAKAVPGGGRKRVPLKDCDIFQGSWVKDDSYPLYREGSCPHIDEPFDCFRNGRPDLNYQKLRWQPDDCDIPRLNAKDMLKRLRGKRLVFVGDSLNRNMWESLVCVLKNSVKDKRRVFEMSGRREFRTEGSYSFLFKDYNCTVEFFRSPFLVQEWEMPANGTKKETLRLDIIERSSSKYKNADVIIFNTGHWWTHEKTSKGKDYYQEGSHIYGELSVAEAFRRALTTWAKWVDANIDPKKTLVFFRGYSASHFRGGQWNSGGKCDKETEPIKNEHYLSSYPPKMSILENVMKGMKTRVSYLNITRMTDYRKDAHPSIYRKPNLTKEDRIAPDRFQDCSHWCLPGVPDSWNELLYAQLIIKQQHHNVKA